MTKIEFLKSKGYEPSKIFLHYYDKIYWDFRCPVRISINICEERYGLDILAEITTQKDIDNLQIAFNNLKRDFEEMQKYE